MSALLDYQAAGEAGYTGGVFAQDMAEADKMSGAYPANGQSWDENAAMYGVSRVIDSAVRAWATVKGSQPATFAGQNGKTYVNGTAGQAVGELQISPLMLVALAGVALLIVTHKG